METILNIVQIAAAALLVTAILLQSKGAGLSGAFGGGENIYTTKRGAEKTLFIVTIVLSVIFLGVALTNILLRR